MSTTRVRISLSAPFAPSKYLLLLAESVKTVSDLKRHLVKSLSTVAQLVKSGRELVLHVDGFELLGGSDISILREQDVISVGLAAGSSKIPVVTPSVQTKKRKLSDVVGDKDEARKPKKKRSAPAQDVKPVATSTQPTPKSNPPRAISSSSSSSSSSLASSSSSSSSSTSSSSSSLYSSSSSSADISTSSPKTNTGRKPSASSSVPFPLLSKTSTTNQPLIPPGQGKSSTHDRNLRRRRARQLQKAAAEAEAARAQAAPNEISLSQPTIQPGITVPTTSGLPIPKDMSNRNKKKGFLEEMKALQPTRTVFNDDQLDQSTLTNGHAKPRVNGSQANGLQVNGTPTRHPIVPPSETDLPSNMFVTSKEFWKPKGGWKQVGGAPFNAQPEAGATGDDEYGMADGYREAGVDAANGGEVFEDAVMQLWSRAEGGIDSFDMLGTGNVGSVKVGDHLAWKELELDMTTFSPVLAVKLARITSTDAIQIRGEKLVKPIDPDFADELADLTQEGEKSISIVLGDLGEASQYRIVAT